MTALKIYRTHENIGIPTFATKQSACFDVAYNNAGKHEYTGYSSTNAPIKRFFTSDKLHIGPHERIMVPTGLILDIPVGYSVRVHPRSGLSLKNGIILANLEGVIDSDYVEELFLLIHNTSDVGFDIHNGDRLAQAELVKVEEYAIEETKEKPTVKTDRVGGMGSTGVKEVVGEFTTKSGKKFDVVEEKINPSTKSRVLKKKMVAKSDIVAVNTLDKKVKV